MLLCASTLTTPTVATIEVSGPDITATVTPEGPIEIWDDPVFVIVDGAQGTGSGGGTGSECRPEDGTDEATTGRSSDGGM